jgi:hypothetical protein
VLADRQIRQPNWSEFGGLFAALGVPEDAILRFGERVPAMTRRPFGLIHSDLHRENLIRPAAERQPLICVDWELATFGDPLHELATHLIRMRYPAFQWDEVVQAWEEAVRTQRPAAARGLDEDLRHYLAFERAQSVYPDVMRAAQAFLRRPVQQVLDEAVAVALSTAAEPLRLRKVPDVPKIERVLQGWLEARTGDSRRRLGHVSWASATGVPTRPDAAGASAQATLRSETAAP